MLKLKFTRWLMTGFADLRKQVSEQNSVNKKQASSLQLQLSTKDLYARDIQIQIL